jgi:hypothetical protein
MSQFVLMLFITFTEILPRTAVSHMPSLKKLDIKLQPNLGVPVALSLVFLELLEEVLTEPDRELSVICVEAVECLLPPKSTEDGTEKLILIKDATPSCLLSQLLPLLHLSLLEVIELRPSPKFLLLLALTLLLTLTKPLKLLNFLKL